MPYTPPEQGLSPFSHTMAELVKGDVRTIAAEAPAVEAARRMGAEGVGSLVVLEGGRPVGIVTKTDLVARVLVPACDPHVPVGEVRSRELVTVGPREPIFEGLLLMIQHGIGHLVVMDGPRLVGVVSERDWLTFQERHPAALLRRIDTTEDIATLARLRGQAQGLVRRLFRDEGTAEALTRFVTEINDRVSQRVITLCLRELEAEAGPPPVPFAWLALGSEGRAEQTLSTDQDNGLLFADVPEAEVAATQAWFLRFAARVVDGLEVCGFPRCKGNVMGSNPELCLPLAAWQRKFAGYLHSADPDALLGVSIYFDFRCLYGDAALVEALRSDLFTRMETQRGFLRHLAGHILIEGRPPIHRPGWRLRALLRLPQRPLDIKRQALGPLTAAVRVLALASAARHTNTLERLREVQALGALPEELARSARSAYDFLMLLRIRHHFAQEERGEPFSNDVVVEALNPLRRRFLEEALETVIDLQDHVMHQYGAVPVG